MAWRPGSKGNYPGNYQAPKEFGFVNTGQETKSNTVHQILNWSSAWLFFKHWQYTRAVSYHSLFIECSLNTKPCLFCGFVILCLWTASRHIQCLYFLANTVPYPDYLFWSSQNRKKQLSLQSLDMPIPYGVYSHCVYYLQQIE